MLQNPFIDIKIDKYTVKNVPTYVSLPNVEVIAYMSNRSLSEISYDEWTEQQERFRFYKSCVYEIRQATEKLSDMGFNKESLIGLLERFYDNHEKGKALAKEIDELK